VQVTIRNMIGGYTGALLGSVRTNSPYERELLVDHLIVPWERKVVLLREFGGDLAEDDFRWSPVERKLLAGLRPVFKDTPLFQAGDRPRPERYMEFRRYITWAVAGRGGGAGGARPGDVGPNPQDAAAKAMEQYRSLDAAYYAALVSAIQDWITTEGPRRLTPELLAWKELERRFATLLGIVASELRLAAANRQTRGQAPTAATFSGRARQMISDWRRAGRFEEWNRKSRDGTAEAIKVSPDSPAVEQATAAYLREVVKAGPLFENRTEYIEHGRTTRLVFEQFSMETPDETAARNGLRNAMWKAEGYEGMPPEANQPPQESKPRSVDGGSEQ
jgi:hypothetical protein